MRNLGRTLLHVLVILVLLMASINARERSSSSGFHQGSTVGPMSNVQCPMYSIGLYLFYLVIVRVTTSVCNSFGFE